MAQEGQENKRNSSDTRNGNSCNHQNRHIQSVYNGAQEVKDTYMRLYQFDYKKACCTQSDFEYEALD